MILIVNDENNCSLMKVDHSYCVNTRMTKVSPKGFQCHCEAGYQGVYGTNGFECIDTDECAAGLHDCPGIFSDSYMSR